MRSMASLLATMLVVLATVVTSNGTDISSEKTPLDVFEWGTYTTILLNRSTIQVFKPPKPMLIVTPTKAGVYPILFFVHGTALSNLDYTQLFHFIASHGIIVVAPLLFNDFFSFPILPSHQEEIDDAADVANWLTSNLNTPKSRKPSVHILPDHVVADFSSFTVSGHSRGGKTSFALALGKTSKKIKLITPISGLIALDPVAGSKVSFINNPTEPHILNNKANSIDLSVPTMIIGTGKGSQANILGVSCAPDGLNHDEFYKELKEGSHFVVTDYGHCDMMNDYLTILSSAARGVICVTGNGPYEAMRTTVGGLIVAFFNSYFGVNSEQYNEIIANPTLAPAKLDPVGYKSRTRLYSDA